MMRSGDAVSVAVRKPDGRVALNKRRHVSWTKRGRLWSLPVLRGAIVLIESLALGYWALNFSARMASEEEATEISGFSRILSWLTLPLALALGLGLFFYLPMMVTTWLGVQGGVAFNLVDGLLRLGVFLAYLYAISQWKEIRRLFEYHGAEHKSIFAYESTGRLDPEEAKAYSRRHPRCGTSFLLIVMLVSVAVFMFLGRPDSLADRLVRLAFVPLIAGLSYEAIKLSDRQRHTWLGRFVTPGLWLQGLTTREPDTEQLEVAQVSLRAAVDDSVPFGESTWEPAELLGELRVKRTEVAAG
ncbi:MAG: DUF1385 domain-containing protein [Calditrichaeota bacterium]|nr:DUF1385 domain-containing protein [Calditrichota bacterium]